MPKSTWKFLYTSTNILRMRTWILPCISTGISNVNKTERSPIRSVIIRVITKSRESDLLITSMITDRIGQHEVLLPINHKNHNFRAKKKAKL